LKDTGSAAVKIGTEFSDNVSDVSNFIAAGGILAAPFTEGTSLAVSGVALSVGTIADVTSLSLKTIDYTVFGGSRDAVVGQAGATALRFVGGQMVRSASSKMVTRTGSAVTGAAFRNPQTGRFVTNQFSHTVTAARDATRVVINVTIPNQPIKR